jgi:membrane-anchored mycosin MYCP
VRLAPALAGLVLALGLPAAPAVALDAYPCAGQEPDAERAATNTRSIPLDLLGVERATELLAARGIAPGEGVRVAVVDSGVSAPSPLAPLTVADRLSFGVSGPVTFGQGTNLAGLVAGGDRADGKPTGVAPAAAVIDLRVYAAPLDSGALDVPTANVTAAVRWLVEHAEEDGIGVVVVGFDVEGDDSLARAVRDLAREDVVIVAAAGDRPTDGQPGFEDLGGEPAPGEDVAGQVLPAGYDGVLGVTSTAGGVAGSDADASTSVLLSSDIDVAVPTYGAVTLAPNGATCAIDPIGSAPAAGIAAGVVALLRSAYPDDNARQIVARLTASATGSLAAPTTATGVGVLQPVEALTQELAPDAAGAVDDMPREQQEPVRVTAPEPEPDPLAGALDDARWWGLVGGGALVVALLARPLLARRQPTGQKVLRDAGRPG